MCCNKWEVAWRVTTLKRNENLFYVWFAQHQTDDFRQEEHKFLKENPQISQSSDSFHNNDSTETDRDSFNYNPATESLLGPELRAPFLSNDNNPRNSSYSSSLYTAAVGMAYSQSFDENISLSTQNSANENFTKIGGSSEEKLKKNRDSTRKTIGRRKVPRQIKFCGKIFSPHAFSLAVWIRSLMFWSFSCFGLKEFALFFFIVSISFSFPGIILKVPAMLFTFLEYLDSFTLLEFFFVNCTWLFLGLAMSFIFILWFFFFSFFFFKIYHLFLTFFKKG